jgi:hypothetical protein
VVVPNALLLFIFVGSLISMRFRRKSNKIERSGRVNGVKFIYFGSKLSEPLRNNTWVIISGRVIKSVVWKSVTQTERHYSVYFAVVN